MAGAALNPSAVNQGAPVTAAQGFGTPVALFNFNRPEMTRRVFEVVRQVRPRRLLLVADGPRPSRPDDARLCTEVRAIFDEVDWDCEVSRNFADTNMGSFKRNSSGLNWVFDTVEEAIILEDDCVPSLSFFRYCEELLKRYRDEQRINVISGNNHGVSRPARKNDSYFFCLYAPTWGWASWRRVWQEVDLTMSWWEPEAGRELLRTLLSRPPEWKFWYGLFESIRSGKMKNAWDYQILLSSFRYSQCRIVPRVNLVSNIGFGADATHCTDEFSLLQDIPRGELSFPLVHPVEIKRSVAWDSAIFDTYFSQTFWQRVKSKLIRTTRRLLKKPS